MDGSKFDHEPVNEEDLLAKGYRKYHGEGIDIYYNKDICEVGRRPWIIPDNGSVENASYVVDTCPSGALKYVVKK
jgi:uncharacterized Fe-S cluster protein YjdI